MESRNPRGNCWDLPTHSLAICQANQENRRTSAGKYPIKTYYRDVVGLQSNMEKPRLPEQASGRMTMFKTPVG